jgi:hypothetical protein
MFETSGHPAQVTPPTISSCSVTLWEEFSEPEIAIISPFCPGRGAVKQTARHPREPAVNVLRKMTFQSQC